MHLACACQRAESSDRVVGRWTDAGVLAGTARYALLCNAQAGLYYGALLSCMHANALRCAGLQGPSQSSQSFQTDTSEETLRGALAPLKAAQKYDTGYRYSTLRSAVVERVGSVLRTVARYTTQALYLAITPVDCDPCRLLYD